MKTADSSQKKIFLENTVGKGEIASYEQFLLFPHSVFNSLPNDKILDLYNLKAFTDNKINVTENVKFVLERVENIVGKGESAG